MYQPAIKLAIADDHRLFREGLIQLLSTAHIGIEVVLEAADGFALLEQLNKQKAIPDICLLDLEMPRMNGYDTLIQLKKKWGEIKVIILSMYRQNYAVTKSMKLGAAAYLTKDMELDEILKTIIQVQEKGYYHNEFVMEALNRTLWNRDIIELTDKELQFLEKCCADKSYADIAKEMNLSARTIESYRDNLFRKLKVSSRTGLVAFARENGLFPLSE